VQEGLQCYQMRLPAGSQAAARLPQQLRRQENIWRTRPLGACRYLRRLFEDLVFSYLVVVAAQLGIANLVVSGPGSIAGPIRALRASVRCGDGRV
jgi:hypothetical protein